MKKTHSVGFEKNSAIKNERSRLLTLADMEDEMDRCEKPFSCPESCYSVCVGCLRARNKVKQNVV